MSGVKTEFNIFEKNKVKINIHFPLRGNIANYCIDLNKAIQNISDSEIDFSPDSFQIPHLTLYMGFVLNKANYQKIIREVYLFSKSLKALEIIPTKPYLKSPKKNYVFIDTNQTNGIIDIKQKLQACISEWIEPLDWDVVNEVPHVTLAYIKNSFEQVETFVNKYPIGPDWLANSLEVSVCGSRGSCLGSIRSFEFI